jgi:phosphopantetheinyl transferase
MQMPLVDVMEKKKRMKLYEKCQHFLNSDELVEWGRVRQGEYKETAKADRLVARAYLRSVLARYSVDTGSETAVSLSCENLVKEPQSLLLDTNAHGKPRLLCTTTRSNKESGVLSGLEFNLSHSHGIIGVAVSYIDSVGLDVEHRKRKMNKDVDLKLARRYFSPTEQEMLQGVMIFLKSRYSPTTY